MKIFVALLSAVTAFGITIQRDVGGELLINGHITLGTLVIMHMLVIAGIAIYELTREA